MDTESAFSKLLLELNNVDSETLFPPQEEDDFYQREKFAKPILDKMIKIYNPDFSDIIVKDLIKNVLNWKGFFLCRFLREIKEIKSIKPLIKLLTIINPLSELFDEVIETLIEFDESASFYLREEYNNRITHNKSIMDLLGIFIRNGDSKKDIVIDSANFLTTTGIDFYINLLADTRDLDYLPVLQKLKKKYRRLPFLKNAIDYSIDTLSSRDEAFSQSIDLFRKKNSFELHKQALKAEKNNKLKEAYEIYEYLTHSDVRNFKSLYGKARVGFKLDKYDYEVTRHALDIAIDSNASLVWINEIKLFKQKLKEKLIQINDFEESDNYKWMEFVCEKCGEIQILRTGKVMMIIDDNVSKNENFYEYEIRCKKCKSKKLKLSEYSQMRLLFTALYYDNEHPDLVKSLNVVSFDDKEIKIKNLFRSIKNQLQKRKNDVVFYIRSANGLKKINLWDEALKLYEISQKADPLIVSSYYSLIKINALRYYDFGNKNAQEIGLSYLEKLKSIPRLELNNSSFADL